MNVFAHKDFELLTNNTEEKLKQTQFHNTKEGSTVRLISNCFNQNIYDLYNYTDQEAKKRMVNHSTGKDLDDIGELLNCKRNGILDDEEYRYRIKNQTTALEKANKTAIMLAGKIPDIQNIKIIKGAFGPGTFAVFPVSINPIVSQDILNKIEKQIKEIVSEGTIFKVLNPTILKTKIKIKQIPNNLDRDPSTQLSINHAITKEIKDYLNSRNIGEAFNFESLKSHVFKNSIIQQYTHTLILLTISLNDLKGYENYSIGWNQRILEHEESDAVIVE
jgi:hypothetical protein